MSQGKDSQDVGVLIAEDDPCKKKSQAPLSARWWGVPLGRGPGKPGGQYLGTLKGKPQVGERKNHFLLFFTGLRSQWFLLSAVGGRRMAAWLGGFAYVGAWYLGSTDGIRSSSSFHCGLPYGYRVNLANPSLERCRCRLPVVFCPHLTCYTYKVQRQESSF